MELKNFSVNIEGQDLWISRSLACGIVCFGYDRKHHLHVLVNKRGQGCEFNKGKWNIPAGFIDYNENATQCACREAHEETGVDIRPDDIIFLSLNTEPEGVRQTMTARFVYLFPEPIDLIHTSNEYSEPDEVAEIRWIPCANDEDFANMKKMKWTRDQVKYIKEGQEFIVRYNKWYNRLIRMFIH